MLYYYNYIFYECLCCVHTVGTVFATNVNQTPSEQIKISTKSLQIQCSHSIQGYNRILWYKQTWSGTLTLLGYLILSQETTEPDFRGKVKMEGSANVNEKNSLTIYNLSLNDSAVYFCAAYAQCL